MVYEYIVCFGCGGHILPKIKTRIHKTATNSSQLSQTNGESTDSLDQPIGLQEPLGITRTTSDSHLPAYTHEHEDSEPPPVPSSYSGEALKYVQSLVLMNFFIYVVHVHVCIYMYICILSYFTL